MKTTPLHSQHTALGANMGKFASYEMPLWYPAGAKAEHLAVIEHAGLFDTSHMAVLTINGPDARLLLQRCFSKDLDACIGKQKGPLVTGRCVYGVFLNDQAEVIDDAIVYQFTDTDFMLVVNAGMGATITDHLVHHVETDDQVEVSDLTDKVGKMDLQGPASGRILAKIIKNPADLFEKMIYFSFKGSFEQTKLPTTQIELLDGTPLMVSRTGYTGEFGFELFVSPEHIHTLWEQLLDAGKEEGLVICGLAARDSLRSGAGLPLSHQDIGDWPFARNPWLFTLPTDNEGKFTKDFIGRIALENLDNPDFTLSFAGYDLRKLAHNDNARVTDLDGNDIGIPLTCTTDMAIGRVDGAIVSVATPLEQGRPADFIPKGLCCGFIKVNKELAEGTKVILTDGKRKLKVEIRSDIRPDRTARRPIGKMIPSL